MKFMKRFSSPFLGLQVGHCEAHQSGCSSLLFELLKYLCIKTKPEEASVNLLVCKEEASPLNIFLIFFSWDIFLLHFSRMDNIIPLW